MYIYISLETSTIRSFVGKRVKQISIMWYQQEEYPANTTLIDCQFFSKPTIIIANVQTS